MLNTSRILLRIISFAKGYRYWMLLASIVSFLTVGSGIGLMMTSAYLIAMAAIQTPIYQLQIAIVGVRFFGISRGLFRYIERYISHEITFKILANLRVWFFESLIPLVPSKSSEFVSGDVLTRSIEDIENLEHIFIRIISPIIVFFFTAALMFLLLMNFGMKYSIVFTFMFIASAIWICFLTFILSNSLGKKIVKMKSILKEFVIDGIGGIKELIIYGQKDKWLVEFNKIQMELINTEQKMNRIMSLHEGLSGFSMNLTVIVLMLLAIPDITTNKLNGIFLSVITIGVMASFEIIAQIPLAFQHLSKSISAANRLFEITDQNIHCCEKIKDTTYIDNSFDAIKVKNLNFSYNNHIQVLSDISFEVCRGKKIAIVGESGSGKTTIVNLLSGLWKSNSGEILIGKTNYKNLVEEEIRKYISVVPQKVHLFTGTIKDNLTIAKESATENELYSVLEKVDLKNFVKSLPDQLNTNIGEFGKQLSGGEEKRISIARALLRDTPILIFDEITSHVDSITEKKILNTIKNIPIDKGVLFITHRLIEMDQFDEIVVLSHGKIIERGTHNQLIANNTFYNRLLKAQKVISF